MRSIRGKNMAILFGPAERPAIYHIYEPVLNINIMTKTYYVCDPTYEQQKVVTIGPFIRCRTYIFEKFQYNICRICICFGAVFAYRRWHTIIF